MLVPGHELIDEVDGVLTGNEDRVGEYRAVEANRGGDALDPELAQRTIHPGQRLGPVRSPGDQLGEQCVVEGVTRIPGT